MAMAKGPGPQAKSGGSPITNGKALHVTIYPRAATKAVLVRFSKLAGQGMSAFVILAALEKIANLKRKTGEPCTVQDLIPEEEYAELLRKRGGKSKK
jgi:hypothetical protein